jgi:fatty acid desaturase
MINTIKKVVFWTLLIYVGLWILFPMIRWILHWEFISDEIKSQYLHFQYYAIPIAILLTLVRTIDLKLRVRENLITLIVTIGFGVIIHIVFIISLFMNMCTYIDKEVMFQHKKDPNKQIRVREMDCGAVDSSEPVPQIFEVNYFSKYFKSAYKIDTTEIDMGEWERVE